MKNNCFRLLILIVIFFAGSSAEASFTLNKIDSTLKNNEEVITINLSGEPDFKYFKLEKPNRFVIDFKNTIWNIKDTKIYEYQAPNHIIDKIRSGIQNGYDLRIVVDSPKKLDLLDIKFLKIKSGYQMIFRLKDPKLIIEKKPIIIIDPGHGGIDIGASGKKLKIHEKKITLAFAKALKKELDSLNKYQVFLTRSKDEYVTLHNRVKFASKKNADLFLSIHADSHPQENMKGLSVYTLSETASDKEAAALASSENKADSYFGLDLSEHDETTADALLDLAFRQQKNSSIIFAEKLVKQLSEQVDLVKNTHRYAGFRVLKNINVPSILLELGYLSNHHEEKLLSTEAYQDKIIKSISRTIDMYFNRPLA